jgi:uncharacterized protein (TIGR00369 family)
LPPNVVELLNHRRGGFNEHIGLTFVEASYELVVAELEVGDQHLQPYGLVHGGIYTAMVETVASTGSAMNALPIGQHTVGLENNTSFLRATRYGKLRARGVPLVRGRRSQVWEVEIRDLDNRLAATGKVRVICIPRDDAIAGEKIELG